MIGIAGMRALWMLKLLKQSLIANGDGTGRQLDILLLIRMRHRTTQYTSRCHVARLQLCNGKPAGGLLLAFHK